MEIQTMSLEDLDDRAKPVQQDIWGDFNYICEEKKDGGRFQLVINSHVKIYSSGDKERDASWLDLHTDNEEVDIVLDGELFHPGGRSKDVVHFIGSYVTDEERRQNLKYLAFDILRYDGKDLTRLTLEQRRKILVKVVHWLRCPQIQVPEWFVGDSRGKKKFFANIIKEGGEGIVLKIRNSQYLPGVRSPMWLKKKWIRTFDVVCTDIRKKKDSLTGAWFVFYGWYVNGELIEVGSVANPKYATREEGEYLIGRVIEIKGDCVEDSGKIRFPRVKKDKFDKPYVRLDKKLVNCVAPKHCTNVVPYVE